MAKEDEEFDGSELRELLAPAVADRGLTSAPTDAIVASGRRRVVGRRVAVAGGALAVVAAVPLAATAIAAGPGRGAATTAAAPTRATPPSRTTTPTHTGAPAPSPTPTTTTQSAPVKPAPPLPDKPTVLASGSLEGKHWSVTAVTAPGNNALTAGDKCLGLRVSEDGRTDDGPGWTLPYCLPVKNPDHYEWSFQKTLQYYIRNGAGTLQMGMVPADVTKVVAHVDGLAPITADTVPAPAFGTMAFYFIPVPKDEQGFGISIDEYNAQGAKIGSWDNSAPNPTGFAKK